MNIKEPFVVEWCEEQNCFHVQPVDSLIRFNLACLYHEENPYASLNWRVVAIVGSYDEARTRIEQLEAALDGPPSAALDLMPPLPRY